jgi:hypothetical protein
MTALVVLAILITTGVSVVAATVAGFRFPSHTATFRCKIRPVAVAGARQHRWPRRRSRAAWVHDVLLVRTGPVLVGLRALAVSTPEEPLRDTRPGEVRGLSTRAVALVIRLDDGALVEVATAARHRTQLVGPFFAAAIPGLGHGPRERRNLGR